jgi:hypothetical protein
MRSQKASMVQVRQSLITLLLSNLSHRLRTWWTRPENLLVRLDKMNRSNREGTHV